MNKHTEGNGDASLHLYEFVWIVHAVC